MKELINQLSSREKKLLYFLICFLIVVGSWLFLITPLLDKHSELNIEYQNILMENSNKQVELTRYQTAPELLKTKKESLQKIIEDYHPILKDEEIDKLLTTLLLNNHLEPISLSMSELQNVTLSSNNNQTNTEETNQDNTQQQNTVSSDYVKQVSIQISVSGSLDYLTKTIDDLNAMDGVQVSAFNYTNNVDSNGTISTTASFTIIIYMTKQ